MLTSLKWNMSPAKPADLQTRNSTKERIVYTSSPATSADLDAVLLLSRQVSLHKLASVADSRVKGKLGGGLACMELHCLGFSYGTYSVVSVLTTCP